MCTCINDFEGESIPGIKSDVFKSGIFSAIGLVADVAELALSSGCIYNTPSLTLASVSKRPMLSGVEVTLSVMG